METGYHGTFVISWSQTVIDERRDASLSALVEGAVWRWVGEPLRVDSSDALLALETASRERDSRRRYARIVHKLAAAATGHKSALTDHDAGNAAINMGFEATDGHTSYVVTLITPPSGSAALLMLHGNIPPSDTDLVVVRSKTRPSHANWLKKQPGGMICLPAGARITTDDGETLVQRLSEGDLVSTRDNGLQRVLWSGCHNVTGHELFSRPDLRPVRMCAAAIKPGHPDADLMVAPHQQVLVSGNRAGQAAQGDQTCVASSELIDERRVVMDYGAIEAKYHYVLLENQEVVWANGLPVETFHPANTDLHLVEPEAREWLFANYPRMDYAPSPAAMVGRGAGTQRLQNSA